MLSRLTVPVLCSALFVLFAFETTASANNGGDQGNLGPYVTSDVVFDGDFAYWVQIVEPVAAANNGGPGPKPPRKVQEVVQQQLSTGVTRRMFATTSKRIEFKELVANAGRLAFLAKNYGEPRESRPVATENFTVYAMNAADVEPVALDSQEMVYRGKFKTKKHKGEKYRYFETKKSCGADVHPQDVSELGVVLVSRNTVSCKSIKGKGKKSAHVSNGGQSTYEAFGYAPGSASATKLGAATYGPMRMRGNELIGAGYEKNITARDITTGTIRQYPDLPDVSKIVASNDGRLAVTSNLKNGKSSPPAQTLTIFPPAANAPALAIPIPAEESSVVAFCGDYFVQLSGPIDKKESYWGDVVAKGPFRLTLRDFTGAVVSEVAGPASAKFAGLGCVDRTARVATLDKSALTLAAFTL